MARSSKQTSIFSQILLVIALLMTIGSALVSYFFVRQNEPKIAALKMNVQEKQILIRDVWSNIGRSEAKADLAILLTLLSVKDSTEVLKIKKDYLKDLSGLDENSSASEIAKALAKDNGSNGDYIDNLYIEQSAMQNQISELEHSNKLYSDIAFFLQILGLFCIILRKDLPEHWGG